MAGAAADALRDALDGLSNRLDPLIDSRPAGDPVRVQLESAQTELENASSAVDALSIEGVLANDADLQKLTDLTAKINTSAAAIAASVANVNRIVTIADKAVALGNALTAGGLAGVLSAIGGLQTAIG